MRIAATLAIVAVATGCGSPVVTPPRYDLALHAELAPIQPSADVRVSRIHLHLVAVTAVSDRSSNDPRAVSSPVDLSAGGAADYDLPKAPPGLYSAVELSFGDVTTTGIDVEAVWQGKSVHATVNGGPFDVGCPQAAPLALGRHARLSLRADPASWFAGVQLATATTDPDDQGILLSNDDNAPQALLLRANVVASLKLDCTSD